MKKNKIKLLSFILFITLFINNNLYAKTRQDIIINILPYITTNWICNINNIIDSGNIVKVKGMSITLDNAANNSKDDRREAEKWYRYNVMNYPTTMDVSNYIWPFEVGKDYQGMAYAFNRIDSPVSFLNNISNGFIVGRRKEDADVEKFAGIDCSSFVSRIIGKNIIWPTITMEEDMIRIDNPSDLKPGDVLITHDPSRHVVVYDRGDIRSNISIYHATGWRYATYGSIGAGNCEQVRRVVKEDGVISKVENGIIKLKNGSMKNDPYYKHVPYTPFPAFPKEFYESKLIKISEPEPQIIPITFNIKAKPALEINSVVVSINGSYDGQIHSLKRSTKDLVHVVYLPSKVFSAGDHTVKVDATNIFGLEKSAQFTLKVQKANDIDKDGLPDDWEQKIVDADPNDNIRSIYDVLPNDDFDNDGLSNIDEYKYGADPTDDDTDNDGQKDGEEYGKQKDPTCKDVPDYVFTPSNQKPIKYPQKNYPRKKGWPTCSRVNVAHDPNELLGPEGQVYPGQTLTYTARFENEGEGIAYGVYITDKFDENIDDSSVLVTDCNRIDYLSGTETPANFEHIYDPNTRTLSVFIDNDGEVGSKQGGEFKVTVKVRGDVEKGSKISNYATVFFPSVPEETPTNTIVSVVPEDTEVSYSGQDSIEYSDTLEIEGMLKDSKGNTLDAKDISYSISNSSNILQTSNGGNYADLFNSIQLDPGNYTLDISFNGDGYYYLPSNISKQITISKETVLISMPECTATDSNSITLSVGITDNEGMELLHQTDDPKTVYLDIKSSDTWKTVGNTTVSESSAVFTFSLSQNLTQKSYSIMVRFEGDSRYLPSESEGIMYVEDKEAPEITINLPLDNTNYNSSSVNSVEFAYNITDNLDPSPTDYAYITNLENGTSVQIYNNQSININDIGEGLWTFTVEAVDWYGNTSSSTVHFETVVDDTPINPLVILGVEGEKYISYTDPDGEPQFGDSSTASGGKYLGWISDGETETYEIVIPVSGYYTPEVSFASPIEGTKTVHVEINGALSGTFELGFTGGWENWQTAQSEIFNLSAGTHAVKLIHQQGYNIDYLRFTNSEENPLYINEVKFIDFNGIAEPNSKAELIVKVGGTEYVQEPIADVNSEGRFTMPCGFYADNGALFELYGYTQDLAGNKSLKSGTIFIKLDITPPLAPIVNDIKDWSKEDEVIVISGTAEPNSTVVPIIRLEDWGYWPQGEIAVDEEGNFEGPVNVGGGWDGAQFRITAYTIDLAGNVGPEASEQTITKDFTAPNPLVLFGAEGEDFVSYNDPDGQPQAGDSINASGLKYLGWITNGETESYAIVLPFTGMYSLNVSYASPVEGEKELTTLINDTTGYLTLLNTGGWENWATVTSTACYFLEKGTHTIKLTHQQGYNIDYINLTSKEDLPVYINEEGFISFKGIGEAETEAGMTVQANGQEFIQGDNVEVSTSGAFSKDCGFYWSEDIDFNVYGYSYDKAGNKSLRSATFYITLDRFLPEAPLVNAINPASNTDEAIEISGITEPYARIVPVVKLNDSSWEQTLIIADSTGNYTASANIFGGANGDEFRVCAYAIDLAGNKGSESEEKTIVRDLIAPSISINNQSEYIANISTITIDFTVNDLDPLPVIVSYLTDLEEGTTIAVTNGQMIEPLSIDDGFWTLTVEAVDWVGQASSSTTIPFEVIHDILPPQSTASIENTYKDSNEMLYARGDSEIKITAIDDLVELGDGIGLGVKDIYAAIDGAEEYSIYTGTFTINTEGEHTINYYSSDVLDNVESTKSYTVIIDTTAPVTDIALSAPVYEWEGETWISQRSSITLTSIDLRSGVDYIEYKVDDNFYQTYNYPFILESSPEGEHTIGWRAWDNLSYREQENEFVVYKDSSAPETTLNISNQYLSSEGDTYITSNSEFKFIAIDTGAVPSGVNGLNCFVKDSIFNIENSSYTIYNSTYNQIALSTFTILGSDSVYAIKYFAWDNVLNTETVKSKLVMLDNTSPVSALELIGTVYDCEGKTYIDPETIVSLSTLDPEISGVASGINEFLYSIDGSAFNLYSSTFTFTEGIHTVKYYAFDNIGNIEQIKVKTLYVDNTPPVSEVVFGLPKFAALDIVYISPKTPISFEVNDPETNGRPASGVMKTEYSLNGAPYIVYQGSFTLSNGTYEIVYKSIDNAGNKEGSLSAKVIVHDMLLFSMVGIEGVKVNGNADIMGDIRSNSLVELKGSPKVQGSVYGLDIVIKGKPSITGEIVENALLISSEPINISALSAEIKQNNDNASIPLTSKDKEVINENNEFKINGTDSITLSTGTYYFTSMDISGNSLVNISGNVIIYCDGDIHITGGSKVNNPQSISSLKILIGKDENNSDTAFKLSGGSEISAIVYAPYSGIDVCGQSTVYGNLFGLTANISDNSKVWITAPVEEALLGSLSRIQNAPKIDDTFKLGEYYSFPNPAKRGDCPTLHIECGIADNIEIKIFNIAGELVHSGSMSGSDYSVVSGKYCYEYRWDVEGIASGVYIYLIRATKLGEAPIKAIKKLAIIK